jgi:F420 biosynthesis protein FbiB-like protein
MSIKDAIKQRRSIRKFQQKPVPTEAVLEILEAAGWAPSAHNSQPWRFIILQDPIVKRELSEKMALAWAVDMAKDGSTVEEAKKFERKERFAEAPVLILACLTMEGLKQFLDKQRQNSERDLALESLGAGLENMLLAAQTSGLGACWYCAPAFCKDVVRQVLSIPKEVEPSAFIILGYPAETPVAPKRKMINEVCYVDKWGEPFRL